ncbi:MAG: hypothetical protein JXA54_00815 [Candidatus Heimdallarchaeota archaeon]|nr:hypothetical protein [Candidatus Heimdallarchaeota archaeon]
MTNEEPRIKIEKKTDDIPIEDIKELLGIVNKEVPGLIKGLFAALYDAETAEQYAKGIATIYRTLTEQGLPSDMVEKLVLKYSSSIDVLGSALKNISFKKSDDEE